MLLGVRTNNKTLGREYMVETDLTFCVTMLGVV
jgi:hypothetical protein